MPVTAQGEGLGWCTHPYGFEYRALNVVLPRTDDVRRLSYATNLARYYGTVGEIQSTNPEELCPVTEIVVDGAGDSIQLLSEDKISEMKEAPIISGMGSKEDRARLMRSTHLVEKRNTQRYAGPLDR